MKKLITIIMIVSMLTLNCAYSKDVNISFGERDVLLSFNDAKSTDSIEQSLQYLFKPFGLLVNWSIDEDSTSSGGTEVVKEPTPTQAPVSEPVATPVPITKSITLNKVVRDVDLMDGTVIDLMKLDLSEETLDTSNVLKSFQEKSIISKPLNVSWIVGNTPKKVKSQRVVLSTNENFSNSCVYNLRPNVSTISLPNLMVATTYFWRVELVFDDDSCVSSATESFKTVDEGFRRINVPGVKNVRDLGGWKTEDGHRIRQGLLYRSAAFDEIINGQNTVHITKEGIDCMRDELKINTELDLRGDTEISAEIRGKSRLGEDIKYQRILFGFAKTDGLKTFRSAIGDYFMLLADESAYPIDFHCAHGKDRTGMLAYLTLALCGVSHSDCAHDYLITYFESQNNQTDYFIGDSYVKELLNYQKKCGKPYKDAVYDYLSQELRIPTKYLDATRDILVEK